MPRRHETAKIETSEDEIRRQLERIFDHVDFEATTRRREMLAFVVSETLAGRENRLKATTIAMEVFGRGADFDQQSDPIVRLEARKLRRDLDNYYAGQGLNDPLRISIPKGHYIPKFSAQWGPGIQNAPNAPQPMPDGKAKTSWRSFVNARRVLVAGACIVVATATFLWTSQADHETTTQNAGTVELVAIHVQNFEARSGGDIFSLVASGLTDEVASALVRFPDISVHLKAEEDTGGASAPSTLPDAQNTGYEVQGSVWQEDGLLFVRSSLIRTADAEVLWSERFTEGTQGLSITEIQERIASQIASEIGQQHGYVLRDVRGMRLNDPNDHSLRGFACVASAQIYRRTYHRDSYPYVRKCLEGTVLEDPDYARAWAMLAYVRNDAARFGHETDLSREAAFDLARDAATRALDLDPRDTDALQAMSHVEQYAGDMMRSIDYARKAVEVNPNDPAAVANLAIRYAIAGRFSEAAPTMRRAIDASVAPPPFYYHVLAADSLLKEDWPEMLANADRAAIDGWSFGQALLAIAHNKLSQPDAARAALDRMAELDPLLAKDPRSWLEGHNMHPIVIDAVYEGLTEARETLSK